MPESIEYKTLRHSTECILNDFEDVSIIRYVIVIEDIEGGLSTESIGGSSEVAGLLLRAAMHIASNPEETRQ